MPGYDTTGPRGQGPMKGGKRGRCTSPNQSAGFGRGLGRGYGRGLPPNDSTKISELNELKAQVSRLEEMVATLSHHRNIPATEK